MSIPFKPHRYQRRAIKFVIERACAALFLDPGLGKTSIALAAFKLLSAAKLVKRALVIAPLRPARSVWPREAAKWDDFAKLRVQLLHGSDKDALLTQRADLDVINPEGLPWLFQPENLKRWTKKWPWQMLIIDECFPGDTLISTPSGQRVIDSLVPGELVITSVGVRRVLRKGHRKTSVLVELRLTTGRVLRCTPEHPVFTDVGWLPARLAEGREVRDVSTVSYLQDAIRSTVQSNVASKREEVLLKILRSEIDVARVHSTEAEEGQAQHERGQHRSSVVEQRQTMGRGFQEKAVVDCQERGALLAEEGWQRNGNVTVREAGPASTPEEVHLELSSKIGWEAARLSYQLQSGLREPGIEAGDRSGRAEPQEQSISRSQEGRKTVLARVARVTHHELGSPVDVFNLEVEGCPHFFAEGTLVHNSTRFKHTNTQRFKILKPQLARFPRRYCLTGSPAPNGLLDLFGQVYVLDLGESLGRYITHYRNSYFDSTGFGGYTWKPREDSEQKIYKKLAPLALHMEAKDHLELPPLVYNTVEVELSPKERRVYDAMEKLLITAVASDTMTAANVGVATAKCRQIANGGLYKDDRSGWVTVHEQKTEAVLELVEELSGKPALIAYEFQHDLARLKKALGKTTPHLGGGVTGKEQARIEDAWNAGDLPVLLAQPQSVAHGLNLQGTGAAVIWHSLTWDLENYEQLIRRVWRQGQEERVVVHHIVAVDTVDDAILAALRRKDKTQRALLDALKAYARARQRRQ